MQRKHLFSNQELFSPAKLLPKVAAGPLDALFLGKHIGMSHIVITFAEIAFYLSGSPSGGPKAYCSIAKITD